MKNCGLNKWLMTALCAWAFFIFQIGVGHKTAAAATIIDHTCTNLATIPQPWLQSAKDNLHIAYGHTSHGSQLTDGMSGLVGFINGHGLGLTFPTDFFAWNNGGISGALDLHDYAMGGDVGYYPDWVNNTRTYLETPNPTTGRGSGTNADVNVIIWSWCGQPSWLTEQQVINEYLTPMTNLENEYFGIKFVYMTSHLDGTGSTGNQTARANQIRTYCNTYNKVLYDFADIESYDPDGLTNYMPLMCTDNCDYVLNGSSHNWATAWQASHTLVDWYNCSSVHSQPLNANRKAYAAWWLWAMLAGWDGNVGPSYTITGTITYNNAGLLNVVMNGLPGNPTTSASGNYTATVSRNATVTVRPGLSGYTFTPVSQTHVNVIADLTNQNFTAAANSSVTPGANGGGGGGGCFINVSINGLSLGPLFFALLLLMTAIRYVKTRRKAISRSTE